VIADLDMPGMDGLTFVSELRGQGYAGPIAVMSVPDIIEKTLESLNTLGVSAAFVKPLDLNEVCRFLASVKAGSPPDLGQLVAEMRQTQRLTAERPPLAPEASPIAPAGAPLAERMLEGLSYLKGRTSAEKLAVFHRDPTSKKIDLVAELNCPALSPSQELGLRYSPVKDVIVEGTVISENEVRSTARARFRNLNRWIDFESCIGVPVVTGETCDHALFLFHRKPVMFNTESLREAQAVANQFGVAIERIALAQERLTQRITILTGEITSAFNHEVFNKVCTLDVFADTLHSGLSEGCDPGEIRLRAEAVRDLATDLKLVLEEFPKISQVKDDDASINEVIAFAADELRERAQRAGVKIRLHLDEHLPEAAGSQPGFHHICLNLMLNAIQQMELSKSPLRLLEVTSFYDRNDPALPIKVRFTDTGPGIHRQHWDDIFKLGFTTRPGGTGLGLYIARSLVGVVNGRLSINESWISAGTQFLLELPVYGSLPSPEIPPDAPATSTENPRVTR
jgi:signal transduction histidine kinase